MATGAYIMEWIERPMPHYTTQDAAEQRMAGILKDFDNAFNPSPKEQEENPARTAASPAKNCQIKILQRPLTIQPKKGDR
jgi:hypothetical protein